MSWYGKQSNRNNHYSITFYHWFMLQTSLNNEMNWHPKSKADIPSWLFFPTMVWKASKNQECHSIAFYTWFIFTMSFNDVLKVTCQLFLQLSWQKSGRNAILQSATLSPFRMMNWVDLTHFYLLGSGSKGISYLNHSLYFISFNISLSLFQYNTSISSLLSIPHQDI
jgi:hypothetical protein